MMTLDEFTIGELFYTRHGDYENHGKRYGKWLCVDKGRHFIVAIEMRYAYEIDPSWLSGPPYAVGVTVMDLYDQQACYPSFEAMRAEYAGEHDHLDDII